MKYLSLGSYSLSFEDRWVGTAKYLLMLKYSGDGATTYHNESQSNPYRNINNRSRYTLKRNTAAQTNYLTRVLNCKVRM